MRKRILSLLLVFCMVLSLLPTAAFAANENSESAAEPASPFADVNRDDWFYEAVRYVSANGIFNGTGENAFAPNATMNRAMFVTVLGRLAGIDPADYSGPTGFDDVPEDAWYAPYVKWAVQFGLTLGTGDGKFSPDAEIDRSQMAVFFVRYFETFDVAYETGAEITTTPADLDSVPDYAKDAVLKLWRQGLLNGDGVNFAPAEKASRAQVATLSQRVDKTVETWYSEPGIPSERESVDPDAQQPQKPEEEKKPGGSSSSGSSSGGGTTTTNYYSVQFALGEGQPSGITLPDTQTVKEGEAISTLPTPYKNGVIFLGWYYDKAMTDAVKTGDKVNRNMTLYAKLAAGEDVQSIERPNYITDTEVTAGEYTFGVDNAAKDDIKFINVTGGNLAVDFTLTGGTVTAALEAGQTYQVELLKDEAEFVIDGTKQGEFIRYLNILTTKTEVKNATLNESVGQLSLNSISGLNTEAFNGIFRMDETNTVAENDTAGTFRYSGNLNIGDTVAITSGGVDLDDPTSTTGDVAYLKITKKEGSSAPYTYHYEMADVDDVLFIPDVLPIESTWDQVTDDGNVLTILSTDLAKAVDTVEAERLDVGDFLGFLAVGVDCATAGEETSAVSYGKITAYTIDGSNYVISYETYESAEAGEAAIASALDVYYAQDQQITLSESDIKQIENEIKGDVVESNYAPQAAGYIAAVMLESNNLSTVPDMDAVEARLSEIEPYILATGTSVQMDGKKVSVDFDTKNINVKLNLNSKLDHLKGKGFNVEIEIPFTVTINDTIEIAIKASFEEEIILRQNISTKRHKTGFLKYDYSLNASFEVGNYTGIGFTADITTTDGGENESMLAKLEDIMDRMENYHESGGVTTTGGTMEGLAEIYQGVMENANDAWIDIVEVKLFENNGNAFLHIFCWQIKGTFVVSANLAVSLGMSFEYITQKQYNFSVRVKDRTSTNETIDIITPQYDFDFYVVGTIGIRAGIRLEMYVGLFSLKLDKIGITAEAGAYARLWGYFFYHLHWEQGQGKTENSAGAMFIEIGMYLDINFVAQLLSSSKLTWNPTIYSNEWPLWSAGEQQNVYAFEHDGVNYDLKVTREFPLPASTFEMKYMDLKSGETGTVNKDSDKEGADEEFFTVSFSNPENFSYDAATNTVKVGNGPDGLGEETDMTITWKKASLAFSSMPIQKVIHITWSDPASVHCITFDSRGGTEVAPIMATPGTSINWPANPTKQGYTFAGWMSMYENDYSATVMPDLNPTRNICLRATWEPNENTKYKVEHYQETLKGTYELAQVETKYGTTDETTRAEAKTFDNYDKPYILDIEQQTIAPDGSTVVKIYYKLKTYTVSFRVGPSISTNDPDSDAKVTRTYKHGEPLAVPTFAYKGHTFVGWNEAFVTDGDLNPIAYKSASYYALWTPMHFNVYFDTMGGTSDKALDPVDFEYGKSIADPGATLTKTGYTFGGWYMDSKCTREFKFDRTQPEESITIYAKWVPNKYTVTLDPNGGTLHDAYRSKTVTYGQAYGDLAETNKPRRTGYAFLGWYTEKDGGERVNADTIVKITVPQTLYAHWEEGSVNYTVKHMQESVSGDSYSEVYDDTQTLTGKTNGKTAAVAKTYTGFTAKSFQQETIAADGSTVVEIYYDRNTFNVSWESDGALLNDETSYTKGTTRYGTQIKAPKTPTKSETGYTYTFDGWYTEQTGGTKVTDFGKVTENVTFYARFTKTVNKYNLTWRPDAICTMSGNYTEGSVAYGTTIVAPTMSREGYKFDGWDKDIPATMPANDLEFTAKWTVNKYTLTLVDDSGTLSEADASKTVTYGYNYNVLPSLSRTGYTFDGWFTAADGGTEIEGTTINITGDLTLYAHWKIKTYTIKYYFADGLTDNHPTTYTCETGAKIPAVSKTGYDFGGWYRNEGFSGESVTSIADTETGNVVLYAKWTAKPHTVTFNANGGSLSEANSSKTVTYGETYGELPTPTHSDTTARFQGWYTLAEGGKKVESTTKVTGEVDETLYAQWKIGSIEYKHITINGETLYAKLDGTVDGYEDGTVTFNAKENELTLNNATITGTGLRIGTYNDKAPSIILNGTNTVTYSKKYDGNTEAYAIYMDLSNSYETGDGFGGTGTLTVSVTDAAIGADTTSVAAIYGRTKQSASNGKYYGYMYINYATVEATVPNVSEGVTAAGVMVGDGSDGSYMYFNDGKLTAKGGTRAIYVDKFADNFSTSFSATVSENYDGSWPTTIEGYNSSQYDTSEYKYFAFPKV